MGWASILALCVDLQYIFGVGGENGSKYRVLAQIYHFFVCQWHKKLKYI
jgi:hypothetical protein